MISRQALERGALVWLLTVSIRGRLYRFSTAPIAVANSDGLLGPPVIQFLSGLEFLEYEDVIGLFDSEASSREVSVSVLFQQGQTAGWDAIADTARDIGEARGELALLIVGDDFTAREIVVSGHLDSPTHGSRNQPVSFTITESDWLDRALIPPASASVRKDTWPQTTSGGDTLQRDDQAKGQHYPWIFGDPGKYPPADWWGKGNGKMPMTPALIARIDTTNENNVTHPATLVLAGHPVYLDGNVNVYNADRDRWFATVPAIVEDDLGRLITVASVQAVGPAADKYIEPGDGLWVAWTSTGGHPNRHETAPLRGAGEIIEYLLGRSNLRIDTIRGRAVLLEVDGFALDFWINEPRSPFDVIKDDLLPLLPLSPQVRQNGLGFVYWKWDAVAADAVDSLDVSAELGERRSDVEVSSIDDVYNTIQIDYCQDGPDGEFRKTLIYSHENVSDDDDVTVNPYSWASYTRYGKREGLIIQAPVIEQDTTAQAVLDWKIRYHSQTHRTVSYRLPQSWQAREVGDVVTVTDSDIGWAQAVCLVTAIIRAPGYADITFTTVADWIRDLT